MKWYHSLIAGMTVLLVLTTCAVFYVAADRESGGGRAGANAARTVQAVPGQAVTETAVEAAVTVEEGRPSGGVHEEPETDPCHHCGGSGEIPCGICGGDGMAEVDCPTCGGSGFITGEPPEDMPWVHPIRIPCPDCGATGHLPGPCTVCSGVGSLPCANCGGSGYEPCGEGG